MFYELCLTATEKHFAGEFPVDHEKQCQVRSSKIKADLYKYKADIKGKKNSREYTCVNTTTDRNGKSRFEFTFPMQNSFAKSKQFSCT